MQSSRRARQPNGQLAHKYKVSWEAVEGVDVVSTEFAAQLLRPEMALAFDRGDGGADGAARPDGMGGADGTSGAGSAGGPADGAAAEDDESDDDLLEEEEPAGQGAPASQLPAETQEFELEPPRAAAPSAMVWDAGNQRARLSLQKAIANVPERTDYLLPALREWCVWRLYALQCRAPTEASVLREWCVWRLYALQCRAPTEASVSEADVDQLVDDLFDMDAVAIERGASPALSRPLSSGIPRSPCTALWHSLLWRSPSVAFRPGALPSVALPSTSSRGTPLGHSSFALLCGAPLWHSSLCH